jgi:hypothetical protein
VAQNGAGELGEETLDQIEPGAVLGRKGELEAAHGLGGEPCFRLLGDVCGMVVEDQLDGGICRIGFRAERRSSSCKDTRTPVIGRTKMGSGRASVGAKRDERATNARRDDRCASLQEEVYRPVIEALAMA